MEVFRTAKQRYTITTDLKHNLKKKHVPNRTNNIEDSSDNNYETDDSADYEACDLVFPDESDNDSTI